MRNRNYYRERRKKAIERKYRILNAYRHDNPPHYLDELDIDTINRSSYGSFDSFYSVKHDGMLSKGKIHCSCEMCRTHDLPFRDKKKLSKMYHELEEYVSEYEVEAEMNKIKRHFYEWDSKGSGYPGTSVHHSNNKVDISEFVNEIAMQDYFVRNEKYRTIQKG